MSKEEYIELSINKLFQRWASILLLSGSFFILSLSFLDYFATPSNFKTFLVYRIIAASCVFITYLINRNKLNIIIQNSMTMTGGIVTACMVALMISKFGGHQSPYFAGIVLVVVYVLAFVPFKLATSIFISIVLYGIFIIPILFYDTITNKFYFISANGFILAIIFITLLARYLSQQRLISELSLQYDLEQQKKQLEVYSQTLENMVAERTKDLQISEQRHRALFDNATDGIVVLDKDGIVLNVNDKTCEMHGYTRDELIGTQIADLEVDQDQNVSQHRMKLLLEGESLIFEAVQRKKDGTLLPLEISSKAITIGNEVLIQSFYRDITEKKKTQAYLFQSQKMESVGLLAGSIAHDFNNILTAIIGHAEVVRLFPTLDGKSLRSLRVIEDASRKAGAMINKLLGFARKSNYEFLPLNLNDVIHDTLKLLEQTVGKTVSLRLELDHEIPLIQGDFNQLEQVITNLLINGRDAMPNGGRLTITTHRREVTHGMPDVPPYVPPGEYVQLRVADTGTGIPEEILQKIFEPFFTTKARDKGTGLGLSMVYGAIKEHKGFITVENQPGSGAMFTMYFPISQTPAAYCAKHLEKIPRGTETILFVDDEKEILTAVEEILTSSGYTVFASDDPAHALDLMKANKLPIDLVITDMVMPKIDGKELIRQIRLINPTIKILAISGYMKYVADKTDISHIDGFLQKPFESVRLLTAVRRVIDRKHRTFMDC